MTVTIDLPPETEARLREQAKAKGAKLEDYLGQLARRWANENVQVFYGTAKTPEQRVADWIAFVKSHEHITAVADDSRESIYEGCGE
jgi:hypothetical protein